MRHVGRFLVNWAVVMAGFAVLTLAIFALAFAAVALFGAWAVPVIFIAGGSAALAVMFPPLRRKP